MLTEHAGLSRNWEAILKKQNVVLIVVTFPLTFL